MPIHLAVIDTHDSIVRSGHTIGDFATDVETVYFNNVQHELYRQVACRSGAPGDTNRSRVRRRVELYTQNQHLEPLNSHNSTAPIPT